VTSLHYVSVCSGIEAATVAWHPLGWEPVCFAEIEPFPSAVLAHHYPHVPNRGDFTTIRDERADLLVGGTPCQSFSVAGLRGGMADARGNLALEYLALAGRLRPRWLVWENVPGVLSADRGRALGAFLGGLAELGYGFAWRVLDAQYAGLAQRRERVFVVGHLGDWRRAAAVLLERASLRGDPAPSRATRQDFAHDVAPSLGASGRGFERAGETRGQNPVVAMALNAKGGTGRLDAESESLIPIQEVGKRTHSGGTGKNGCGIGRDGDPMFSLLGSAQHAIAHSLRADGFDASEDGTGRGTPLVPISVCMGSDPIYAHDLAMPQTARNGDPGVVAFSCKDRGADAGEVAPTLRGMGHSASHANGGGQIAVAFDLAQVTSPTHRRQPTDLAGALHRKGTEHVAFNLRGRDGGSMPEQAELASVRAASGGSSRSYVASMAVRRLTPTECERLQGFPDGYTLVLHRGKLAADGPRYKALGNSMAVPVMRWIGERIALVDATPHVTSATTHSERGA
jgi:DNA (cytosine-5)-methyltransferase 1